MKWKLTDFWVQLLSCTLGTVIGIILTFGTSAWIEHREQQETERTAALMVIHNLEAFCDDLEDEIEHLQAVDSLIASVQTKNEKHQTISEDSLLQFVSGILDRNFTVIDQTAENIFSSNIETWKSINSSEFIELAGKCFSAKRLMVRLLEELDTERHRLYNTYMQTVVYADKPSETIQETVARMLCSPAFCAFIKQQHDYLAGMEAGLTTFHEKIDNCKRLMEVNDDELKQFGYNE